MGSECTEVMKVARVDTGCARTAFCSVGIADSCGTNPSPPKADAVSDSNMRLAATGADAEGTSMVRDLRDCCERGGFTVSNSSAVALPSWLGVHSTTL
jgi:hypothetical protein